MKKRLMPQIIFIHPFKTAGGSISKIIKQPDTKPFGWHLTAKYQIKRFNFDKCFVFATTRNPWDRLVSIWHYGQGNNRNWLGISSGMTFSNWIKIIHHWFRPKGMGVCLNSTLMCVSVNGQIKVDYFVNFHTLQEDIKMINMISGENKTLPHLNKTLHQEYQYYYNDETRDIVGKLYSDDIKYFGYCFEDKNVSNFERIVNKRKIKRFLTTFL